MTVGDTPLLQFVLRRADDALILGHRLSEWCGHAPMMEEDIALANMALDLLGQARALFGYAAELDGGAHDEDDFAYLRDVRGYGNALLLEQPNGDFAHTIVRQFLYAAYIDPYWRAMMRTGDATLAAIAAKAEKETAYHLRHAAEWVIRLGDGTHESHTRCQAAVDALWPFTGELFEHDAAEHTLIAAGLVPDARALHDAWSANVAETLEQATLRQPPHAWMQTGGRAGRHSEHLGHLLSDLQYLQRAYPGGAVVNRLEDARGIAGAVVDPEIPVLTIADLGVLRDVRLVDGVIEISITPTYSGCPAMNMIGVEIGVALDRAGLGPARVRTVLSPAWTTDWMSEAGRAKLLAYGVAPPVGSAGGRRALFGEQVVQCPLCGATDSEELAAFGSTSCKSLWRCRACREPFDYFKCH